MTSEQVKKLIPEKSFVKYAGGNYCFAGRYPEGHILHNQHLLIYDEPPSVHVDSVNISSCEIREPNT